jgi:hypothetical protein
LTGKVSKLIAIVLVAIVVASGVGYWLFVPKASNELVTYTTHQASLSTTSEPTLATSTMSTAVTSVSETTLWINVTAAKPVSYYVSLLKSSGTQPYVQLGWELQALPDATNTTAVAEITYLALNATNPEVKEAFQLMVDGGTPNPRDFTYTVPNYNTELEVLYWLASQNEFKKDDTLALAIAMVHGLWVTMGDRQVREAVKKDTSDLLAFFRETNELQKQRGYSQLEEYPLEAKLSLSYRSYLTLLMGPFALYYDPTCLSPYEVFNPQTGHIKPFPLIGYNWGTVSLDTLRKMQKVMDSKGWITGDVGKTVSQVEDYLYFSGRNGKKGEHWYYVADFQTPEKSRFIVVDGLNVSIGNINNVNWQLDYFMKNDQGIGGCTDEAALVDGFAKSWGIATTAHFRMNKLSGTTRRTEFTAHTYVTYFDPQTRLWKAYSKQLLIDKGWMPEDSTSFLGVLKPPVKQPGYIRNKNEDVFFVANIFYMIRNTSLDEIANTWTIGVQTSEMKQWLLYS